jgi:hemerythrin-like metal-binding protein
MNTDFFPWKNEYGLGIEEIDNQHRKLIALINKLYEAFIKRSEKENMNTFLKEMLDYARYHFETEEKYFQKIDYPKASEHIKLHNDFEAKAIEFRHRFRLGDTITSTLMKFLRDWLKYHILKSDREYAEFLKSK